MTDKTNDTSRPHVVIKTPEELCKFLDDLSARSRANVRQLERKTAWLEKKFPELFK